MSENLDKAQAFLNEIEVIQNLISRMARNSFWVKGWTVILVALTLLLKGGRYQVFVAFIPLLIFWWLDAFFLHHQRLFRRLYKWVIVNRPVSDQHLFDLNPYRFAEQEHSRFRIMFSWTLGWFYGALAVLVAAYAVFLFLATPG